ncbi:MAG: DUF2326 domain-containing protein [Agitococcus sp.]|nr:DUF2326 domain-containing protein [Agitococcus sp.]
MRLISLTANQPSFKSVSFNQQGLSLIIGIRTTPEERTNNLSYNGVGKSLLVEIIHFCLGSSSNTAFKEFLPEWSFTLEFEHLGKHFTITRETNNQKQITFNNEILKLKSCTDELEKIAFDIPAWQSSALSFRSLIPRFVRRGNADYNNPKNTNSDKEAYTELVRNLFLLGIDISLPETKHNLRVEQTRVTTFEKNFKKDPYIREYYTGNKDASLQAKHLEEQIFKLETNLSSFQIAEDYYDIEKEANRIAAELNNIKNKKFILQNTLANIDKSLTTKADIPKQKILDIYHEITLAFKEEALKRLDEIEAFHHNLLKNRFSRLTQEKIRFSTELAHIEKNIHQLSLELDSKLSYLSDKRALDQYIAVSSERAELIGKLQKLQDYQQLIQKSRDDIARIQERLASETIKTSHYLQETLTERESVLSLFTTLSKRFYPNAPAGITLSNNVGDNTIRYDFDVRIEADGSDGINAVKIFCYDLTVLLLERNHRINFIWHDSRLFSDIDPRQRAVLFRIAQELTAATGKQYIASVNQDQLEAMKTEFTESEYENLFSMSNIVLTLQDDGAESKLLGMQIDMQYQR